jgi:hypothetical protein
MPSCRAPKEKAFAKPQNKHLSPDRPSIICKNEKTSNHAKFKNGLSPISLSLSHFHFKNP